MKRSMFFILYLVGSLSVNAQVINTGVSGNTTLNLLERLNTDVLQQQPDLVILMVGTNDMLNSKKMISYKSYEINLRELVNKIQASGTKILLLSPPPVDSVYLFQRHDKTLFKDPPNTKLDSVRQIMQKVSIDNGLQYLDIHLSFQKRNLPEHNSDLFIRNIRNSGRPDGVHPTALGYHFIAASVFAFIKTKYESFKSRRIVCFGDSITYGSSVKQGGTVQGDSYPAVLERLID